MGFHTQPIVSQERIEPKHDTAQNHDRVSHHVGPAAHNVVLRNRRRCDETDRGTDDRRDGDGDSA